MSCELTARSFIGFNIYYIWYFLCALWRVLLTIALLKHRSGNKKHIEYVSEENSKEFYELSVSLTKKIVWFEVRSSWRLISSGLKVVETFLKFGFLVPKVRTLFFSRGFIKKCLLINHYPYLENVQLAFNPNMCIEHSNLDIYVVTDLLKLKYSFHTIH